ncbi:bifunctional (p)ppGpp synthetase/guanosine-3',5'-bis(diphosphate) 3'-pyrophosphohydrolase [Actinomadura graeca]|uniref:Bifunctional (P)ppGpp synthetase/guanosine-3',5'-bis(Diphosphate) 3'-pyrophosphohydrolase n=1 Tax=Actinomadura graeca TaxID=2750812 RepID=A0ABX8QTJ3_9ACTN|nr:HD domain-containing protein [Actinomadura graeca]QXJ22051.1 bifunctional (p)ppGpp synthetase/guanosine-3',5'-bis(diphosphate) 3'-pyrophosphohydrolase [Actinomadura graeca]
MEVFTHWRTWDAARAGLAGSGIDLDRLERAAVAAQRWHGGQLRPTGVPYVEHLLEALEALVRGAGVTDPAILDAVLLHDVVEDTGATVADIEAAFGDEVAELVDWVTEPPAAGPRRQARRAARSAYLRRLRDAPREAILVKLSDRVSNVQRLDQMPPDFQRRYYAETVTYILPLAEGEPWFAAWFASWRERFAHLR